ncbi:hypothetical protein, partial [Chryseobacterium lathyri]|uniref:hypothetical protein n=1 Tax=Chryseobacterium lathyri TaxID=395933 RepID=UPI001E42D49B
DKRRTCRQSLESVKVFCCFRSLHILPTHTIGIDFLNFGSDQSFNNRIQRFVISLTNIKLDNLLDAYINGVFGKLS